MDRFYSGFVAGSIATFVCLLVIAKVTFGILDDACAKQDWKGESCQCRLLEKSEPKP